MKRSNSYSAHSKSAQIWFCSICAICSFGCALVLFTALSGAIFAADFTGNRHTNTQSLRLIGWVYDNAEPLRGASVTILQDGKRVAFGACDSNGKFRIRWRVSKNVVDFDRVVLRANSIGYYPREYKLTRFSNLDQIIVSLTPTLVSLLAGTSGVRGVR